MSTNPDRSAPYPLSAPLPNLSPDTLNADERKILLDVVIETKKSQELYLRDHPELKALVTTATRQIAEKRPEDVTIFLKQFFSAENEEFLRRVASDAASGRM